MRVVLKANKLDEYFNTIKEVSGLSLVKISNQVNVSPRTLNDWRRGIYSIPLEVVKVFELKYNVKVPHKTEYIDERIIKANAGRIGGIKRYKIYGNPGTIEGRKKGGLNSLKTHRLKQTKFKTLKLFPILQESKKLSEFFGIMIGDGGMSNNQLIITLNSLEVQYIEYVSSLILKLFQQKPALYKRENITQIVLSSKDLVNKLHAKGLLIGNKIRQNVGIPVWISNNNHYVFYCLRGIFDTDGCIYQDTHTYKGKTYKNVCLAYTTYSQVLFNNIVDTLRKNDLNPVISSKNRVGLRRKEEVIKFFNYFKPANQKHLQKYKNFLEE